MSTLLQTLQAASGRVQEILTGTSPTPGFDANTPAGCHDASDATLDDAADEGDSEALGPALGYGVDYTFDTATAAGTIDFVRVKLRAKYASTPAATQKDLQALVSGTARGTPQTLTTSFAAYQFDLTTDNDASAWTLAKINARKFGFYEAVANANISGNVNGYCSEITVEVWGTFPQSSTPSATSMTASVSAPTVSPGPVSSTPASVGMAASSSGATGVPGLRVVTPASVSAIASVSEPISAGPVLGSYDPTRATTANFVKLIYKGVDADRLLLADADTNTYRVASASRPPSSSGTLAVVGAIQDNYPAPPGDIAHIVIRAQAFAVRYDVSTISNLRVEYGSPLQSKAIAIPVRNNLVGLTAPTAYALVETAAIPTRPDGQAWTWADVNALGDLTFKADFTIPFVGNTVELYVNECWIEVYMAQGSFEPPITLTQKLKPITLVQTSEPAGD